MECENGKTLTCDIANTSNPDDMKLSRIFEFLEDKYPSKTNFVLSVGEEKLTRLDEKFMISTAKFNDNDKEKYKEYKNLGLDKYGNTVTASEWQDRSPEVFVTKDGDNTVASLLSGEHITFPNRDHAQVTDTEIITKFQTDHGKYVDSKHIHRVDDNL